jgi:hypothetical protein
MNENATGPGALEFAPLVPAQAGIQAKPQQAGSPLSRGRAESGSLVRFFRRGPWENAAMTLIGAGIVMLVQPFSLDLYGYSFVTILAGTLGYVAVSHFPE